MILPGRPNVIRACIANALTRVGRTYHNRIEPETLSLCLELTRRGLGYTVMPIAPCTAGSKTAPNFAARRS